MKNAQSPREMIEALVGIPTVSRDSNLALIEFVQNYLYDWRIDSTLIENDDGTKANLYATVGPMVPGGVVLSGHTDVVPTDGQPWSTDPFQVAERDGRLYGRGTCDMKSFYAIALALVPEMRNLRRPIHFALSYDEEVGCLGAPDLIEALTAAIPEPEAIIVGEPTGMRIVNAHKSIFHFTTRVTGHAAHSSQPHRGVSAVMVAARLVNWIAERQRRNAETASPDCAFEPPFTSLHCGMIHGGTAPNIMARSCEFVTDVRCLPGESGEAYLDELRRYVAEEIEPEMRRVSQAAGVEFTVDAAVPAFESPSDSAAVRLVERINESGPVESVPYAAEAGQYQQAGYSVAMCGPGSIDQAHRPDEYISLDQVDSGTRFLRRLIEHLS
jgi:acetylornithine deacetylase